MCDGYFAPIIALYVQQNSDILVIGASAAGLFKANWAGRGARPANASLAIAAVDGANKLGGQDPRGRRRPL